MINIKKFLRENADTSYADFNKKFITSQYQILGVRTPVLKKFAKEIEPEYIYLKNKTLTHEEILLYGFSASYLKTEDEQLEYLQNVLPFIDNWATCDGIVCSLKKLNQEKSYNFFLKLLKDDREFYIRVGIVGLMRYFIKSDNIKEILNNISQIKNKDYYVKMATAWFYAELAISNFDLAYKTIENTQDKFIRNKSISKAKDSFRVTEEQKEKLSKLLLNKTQQKKTLYIK